MRKIELSSLLFSPELESICSVLHSSDVVELFHCSYTVLSLPFFSSSLSFLYIFLSCVFTTLSHQMNICHLLQRKLRWDMWGSPRASSFSVIVLQFLNLLKYALHFFNLNEHFHHRKVNMLVFCFVFFVFFYAFHCRNLMLTHDEVVLAEKHYLLICSSGCKKQKHAVFLVR